MENARQGASDRLIDLEIRSFVAGAVAADGIIDGFVTQIARTADGAGYGGQEVGSRVVKWTRQGDRILLRAISYRVVADPSKPIARAVQAANNEYGGPR